MSRKKTRVVAWLDPAKPLQREVIASIEEKPPKERHQYILALLLRGYEFSGDFGTRSILAIARRYGGLCSFQVENGEFVLRLSI